MHGSIGGGGVVRNSEGTWFFGFMKNIGHGEVLQAEAWGLVTGLQIAEEMNITRIEVESDSATLISLVQSNNPLGTLIHNVKFLLRTFEV